LLGSLKTPNHLVNSWTQLRTPRMYSLPHSRLRWLGYPELVTGTKVERCIGSRLVTAAGGRGKRRIYNSSNPPVLDGFTGSGAQLRKDTGAYIAIHSRSLDLYLYICIIIQARVSTTSTIECCKGKSDPLPFYHGFILPTFLYRNKPNRPPLQIGGIKGGYSASASVQVPEH